MRALKILLSVLLLSVCFFQIDFATLWNLLKQANFYILAVFPIVVIIHTIIGASRFKLLLDPHQILPLSQHIRQYFIANYFNLLLPSSIGGDAIRIFLLNKFNILKSEAATYVFSERLMGLYSLIFISLTSALVITVSEDTKMIIYGVVALSILSFLGIYVVVRLTKNWKQRHIQSCRQTIIRLWQHKLRLFMAVLISLIYQGFTISFTLIVAIALEMPVNIIHIFALVPLVWLATIVPIGIGGVGVRELSFLGLFTQVGLSSEQAVLLSLGTYASMVIAGAIGALWTTKEMLSKSGEPVTVQSESA